MSEEHPKLKRLRDFLGNGQRVVCFQINGPSIAELPKWLSSIPEDVVWVGHNFYWPTERILGEYLGHHSSHLDLVYVSAPQMIETCGDYYREFLERSDDNLLVTTTGAEIYFEIHQKGLLKEFESKVIVTRCEEGAHFPEHAFEVIQYGGPFFSFVFALLILLKAGVQTVILFGLDGGIPDGYSQWYYGEKDDYPGGWFDGTSSYSQELDFANGQWPDIVKSAGLDQSQFQILNCSPKSNFTCFEKIGYQSLNQVFGEENRENE